MSNKTKNHEDMNHAQNTNEMCQDVQPEMLQEAEATIAHAGTDVQPRVGHVVTLHGNGGTVNGASTVTMTLVSRITIGELPRATPNARFLGWSQSHTGSIMPPQILVDSDMILYARFEASAAHYNQMTRGELAQEILHRQAGRSLSGRRITFNPNMDWITDENRRSVRANLEDTAAGLRATRPTQAPRVGGGSIPPGGVFLSENLLRAILRINDRFGNVTINTIAGGYHSGPGSRHYQGQAVDFRSNGSWQVYGTNPLVRPSVIWTYLRNTWGFDTTGSYEEPTWFHLEIRN